MALSTRRCHAALISPSVISSNRFLAVRATEVERADELRHEVGIAVVGLWEIEPGRCGIP